MTPQGPQTHAFQPIVQRVSQEHVPNFCCYDVTVLTADGLVKSRCSGKFPIQYTIYLYVTIVYSFDQYSNRHKHLESHTVYHATAKPILRFLH